MRRLGSAIIAAVVLVGGFVLSASPAGAAGIVTHSWMGLDAIDHVRVPALQVLLDAHRDQLRAGAQFPDGGYWTRDAGTPGGDYGEEAHWQRFVDAYTAQIRDDASCGTLADPNGPCAATIAHLMGVAAHGMGDEVWDWLFEPNGPGFVESYIPPEFAPFVGPGGLELQMDLVAIMRHGQPTGPTPDPPDLPKIEAAFVAAGRPDVSISAIPVGESGLDLERSAEAFWAPTHIDALERAMPWTSSHMTTSAGGVDFAARAIAAYYESIWARLNGTSIATRVGAVAPAAGQTNVPSTGWTGNYAPGSNAGNKGGLTRIAAALSSALPHNALAGGGPVSNALPTNAFRLRNLRTHALVSPAAGYPRIVPYNPEAGEHEIAFQPATDLQPCTWYQAEVTSALVDAAHQPVTPKQWRFRTSGCVPRHRTAPVRGTVACDARGAYGFPNALTTSAPGGHASGGVLMTLTNCAGGQDGTPAHGSALPIRSGIGGLVLDLPTGACRELDDPTAPATAHGLVLWRDAQGRDIGRSDIDAQSLDLRGGVVHVTTTSTVLEGQSISFRLPADLATCGSGPSATLVPFSGGRVTSWAG